MRIEGVTLHDKCDGLGIFKNEEGKVEVCVECMGSGMITGEVEVED